MEKLDITNLKRLMQMQEKVLAVNTNNREVLNNYGSIVSQIDEFYYDQLKNAITSLNDGISLEEESKVLSDILKQYNDLKKLQDTAKEKYNKISYIPLKLSNIELINIEEIEKRIEKIKSYLNSNFELSKLRDRINTLSKELANETEKNDSLLDKVVSRNDDLLSSFINGRGKVFNREIGSYQIDDIFNEYRRLGIDLDEIMHNKSLMATEKEKAQKNEDDLRGLLKAANDIVNKYIPSNDNKENTASIKREHSNADYVLTLINLADEMSKEITTVSEYKDKMTKLDTLLKHRRECLKILDIKYKEDEDPYERTEERLKSFLVFNDNTEIINNLKRKISDLNNLFDATKDKNRKYLQDLSVKAEYLKKEEVNGIDFNDLKDIDHKVISDNQVKSINDVNRELSISLVHRKTDSVINRVYEMVFGLDKKEKPTNRDENDLELIIGDAIDDKIDNTLEDTEETLEQSEEHVFTDENENNESKGDISKEETLDTELLPSQIFTTDGNALFAEYQTNSLDDNKDSDKDKELNSSVLSVNTSTTEDDGLFDNCQSNPFTNQPILFDRVDDSNTTIQKTSLEEAFSSENANQDVSQSDVSSSDKINPKIEELDLDNLFSDLGGEQLPDAFWTVKEAEEIREEDEESFEDKIGSLLR